MAKVKETLVFKRMATKAKDGHKGAMYIHTWGTGYQELIFDSKEIGERAKKKMEERQMEPATP